jgi:glycosyltransferase involved in cell wall biosynthesis
MEFVRAHGLDQHVEFTGAVSTDTLIRRIRESDVVILPSIEHGNWVENQACIVQEAMLMKSLVIATTTGGVPESTAPALHRFMVPAADPTSIAEAILAVRALPDEEMRRLGEEGRAFAESRYDIRRLNESMMRRIMTNSGGADAPVPKRSRSVDRLLLVP